jgi:predicted  nucleic acid-binding Zn-ribbon protein
MHPDLEHVIRLQQLEDAAELARRTVAGEPAREQELDARLAAAQAALDGERQRLAANQAARREIEKDLAEQQGRSSKFKNQLMEVKTNREYQAVQKEIEVALHEIQVLEDALLERMIEFDEVTRQVKAAEKSFAAEKASIEADRAGLATSVVEARDPPCAWPPTAKR